MKKSIIWIGISLMLVCFLSGCATTPVEDYLEEHPEVSSDIGESMKKGEIKVGMTKEETKLVAGYCFDKRAWIPLSDKEYFVSEDQAKEETKNVLWTYKKYKYISKKQNFDESKRDVSGNYTRKIGVRNVPERTRNYTEIRVFFKGDKLTSIETQKKRDPITVNDLRPGPDLKGKIEELMRQNNSKQ